MAEDDDTQATQSTLDDLKRRAQQATAGVTTQPAGALDEPPRLQNPFPEKAAQAYMAARSEQTARMGADREVFRARLGEIMQPVGAPGAPRLEQPPKAPEVPIADAFRVFQNPAVMMMTIGSLFTKTPAITAFKAAAAAMDGYSQGNQEAYDRLRQIWKDKTEEVRDRNRIELEKNSAAWKSTEHNARERLAKLHALAIEHQDVVQQHNTERGDLDAWWGLQTMRMKAQQHLDDSLLKHDTAMALIEARSSGRYGTSPEDIKELAQGIVEGKLPPNLTGFYRQKAPVEAELHRMGFDLGKANLEWNAANRQIVTLNGAQMTRFAGLGRSVLNTIDEVKRLANEMQLSGVVPLNRVELESFIKLQGNTPNGRLATRYVTAINTLKEEFANLAQGGYAPTESVWALANKQINENYGVSQLGDSLDEVKRLIGYRLQAIPGLSTLGPTGQNRYTGQFEAGNPASKIEEPAAPRVIEYDREGNRK